MLKSLSGEDYGSVTWEVSKSTIPHTHWQYLPVPVDYIRDGRVEAAFKVLAENYKWPEFETKDVGDGFEEQSDFFRVMIWDPKDPEDQKKSLVMRFDRTIRFQAQFGREVLGKLLRLDNRIDWHNCGQTEEEEKRDAAKFRAAFKEFDFTLGNPS